MIGTTISHYEITAELGRGGMGVVYKAHDTRLGRDVAIKVLAASLRGDETARARFEQEARAASALNHDHIGVVHEIGETDDGHMYMALAYYEGATLDTVLSEGALQESVVTQYASQTASALAAAHANGIVHRDIKPSNLIVPEGGSLKVLDFGLATFAGAADLTATGSTIGTMAYMSPEQTKGDDVGPASDVWSLGVVLYEMLAGRKPFDEGYASAVVYSILNQDPAPLEGVDPGLAETVEKCLAKNPEDRPSAEELVHLLADSNHPVNTHTVTVNQPKQPLWKGVLLAGLVMVVSLVGFWLTSGEDGPQFTGVAVIPCRDLSAGQENVGLGISLAEALSLELMSYPQLRVPGQGSTIYFKDNPTDAQTIGEQLGVDFVMNCSINRDQDDVLFNVMLAEVDSGTLICCEPIEETFDRLFALQQRVQNRIIEEMKIQLLPGSSKGEIRTMDPRAYEAYLKALEYLSSAEWNSVIRYTDDALALDSTFAEAHALKAEVMSQMMGLGILELDQRSTINFHIEKAISLDPENDLFKRSLSFIQLITNTDWVSALETVASIEFAGYEVQKGTAQFDLLTGNFERMYAHALAHEKLNGTSMAVGLGAVHYFMRTGYLEDTERILTSLEEMFGDNPFLALRRAEFAIVKEEFGSALEILNGMVELGASNNPFIRTYQGIAAAGVGDIELMHEVLSAMEAIEASFRNPRFHLTRAFLKNELGNVDEAIDILEAGVEAKALWSYAYGFYITEPNIRAHPRFQALIRRSMPGDVWLHAEFNRGGMLLNREELEEHALDWRTLYAPTD